MHMHTGGGGVSPRNFQATEKYQFSCIAVTKYQLILSHFILKNDFHKHDP